MGALFEKERQNDALCLRVIGIWVGRIAVAIRRVGLSHEELALLVVRPSVGVRAPPEGRFFFVVEA